MRYLHATSKQAVTTNAGIKCIRNPPILCQNEPASEKTSNEKDAIKMAKQIPKMRGNQMRKFVMKFGNWVNWVNWAASNQFTKFNDFNYKVPLLRCSSSMLSNSARKLPLPKDFAPLRWMISKKSVGRSSTGLVKICRR